MKPIVLGPKYAIRLGDLQRWHVLTVKCWRCPRQGLVDPEDLRDKIDKHEWLKKIEDRFRCKGCGNKVFNNCKVMIWSSRSKPDRLYQLRTGVLDVTDSG